MNNMQRSRGTSDAEALRLKGLRQFICPKCHRMHWEIDRPDPNVDGRHA
jgi:hypothetical protein